MGTQYDILIIEDEKIVIESVKKILIPEGFKVDDTFDVEHALGKLKQNKYKLILTDLMLPKISGLKLIEIVNEKYSDIPIIMITGFATLENAVQSLKAGAFDFIPKPFAFEELLGVVYRAKKYAEMRAALKQEDQFVERLHHQRNNNDNFKKYYSLGKHLWAKLDRDGSAKLGIGEIFHKIIGKIQKVEFPPVNQIINQGNVLVRIYGQEQLLHTVWSPLSGKVIENNQKIKSNKNSNNKNLFLQDWLVCIIPTNLEEELVNLTVHR